MQRLLRNRPQYDEEILLVWYSDAVPRRMKSCQIKTLFWMDPCAMAHVADLGDVPFPRANDNEHCIQQILHLYTPIAKTGTRLVSKIEPDEGGFTMDWAVALLHAARGMNFVGATWFV